MVFSREDPEDWQGDGEQGEEPDQLDQPGGRIARQAGCSLGMWGGGQRKGCSLSRLSSYSCWMILSVPLLHYTPQVSQIVYGRILSLLAVQIFAFITVVCQLLVYFCWPSWLPLFSSHAPAPVSTGAAVTSHSLSMPFT